jgi:hyperosmotically inducible periplasmic protein
MKKMKILRLLPVLVLVAGLAFTGCKPKDADIKASIEKSLKESPATAGVMVMVNEGVATLSGEVPDQASKTALEATVKSMKGVKSVQDNTTLPAPPAAAVEITADDPLMSAVKDATIDFPTVTATVASGIITLTGELKKDQLSKLMMTLNSLKPKKIENKLTIK